MVDPHAEQRMQASRDPQRQENASPEPRHSHATAIRIAATIAAAAIGVLMFAETANLWPESVPASPMATVGPTFSPTDGVYRYGYSGGIEDPSTDKPIQWINGGRQFAMTTGGSGQCLNEPIDLEVVAPDQLRIELKMQDGPEGTGCRESNILTSYVLNTPAGIDPTRTVRVERKQVGTSGSSSTYIDPL